jgi:hypothetical protein
MRNVENKQFPFKVTAGRVQDLKKKHKMRQKNVANYYISSKDNATSEETVKSSELFKKDNYNYSKSLLPFSKGKKIHKYVQSLEENNAILRPPEPL